MKVVCSSLNRFGRTCMLCACIALLAIVTTACGPDPEPTETPTNTPLLITPVIGEGMVIAVDATLHVEPDGTRIGTLGEGERIRFMAVSADGDWTLVQTTIGSNTLEGWVRSESIDKVTPTPLPPTSTTASEAATDTPEPATNTPTLEPEAATNTPTSIPPTNTPTSVPATNTPTSVPPTNTPTRRPATSTPRPPTATPSGPLTLSISVLENTLISDNEARVKIRFNANGGAGSYHYFRDGFEVTGPEYEFQWGSCKTAPMTLKVADATGGEVSLPFAVNTPCPDLG